MNPSNLKIAGVVVAPDTKPQTQTVKIDAIPFGKLASYIGLGKQDSGKWQRGSSEAVSRVVELLVKELDDKGFVTLEAIQKAGQTPTTTAPTAPTTTAPTTEAPKAEAPKTQSASLKNKA